MRVDVKFGEQSKQFGVKLEEAIKLPDSNGYTPSQEKSIEITENGTIEVTPDDGYLLSKVVVSASIKSDSDINAGIDAIMSNAVNNIDSDVDDVRNFAFYALTSLITVNFSNKVRLGDQCFRGCTNLIKFNALKANYVGSYAFYSCTKLGEINLPSAITVLTNAFAYCYALRKADFGVAKSIAASTFNRCNMLDTMIIRSATVATLENINAFNDTPIANGTGYIYVPTNIVESYKAATNWVTYASQIRSIDELEET